MLTALGGYCAESNSKSAQFFALVRPDFLRLQPWKKSGSTSSIPITPWYRTGPAETFIWPCSPTPLRNIPPTPFGLPALPTSPSISTHTTIHPTYPPPISTPPPTPRCPPSANSLHTRRRCRSSHARRQRRRWPISTLHRSHAPCPHRMAPTMTPPLVGSLAFRLERNRQRKAGRGSGIGASSAACSPLASRMRISLILRELIAFGD